MLAQKIGNVAMFPCKIERPITGAIFRVHLRAIGDEFLGGLGVAGLGGLMERFGIADEWTNDEVLNARGNGGATGNQHSGQNE